MPRWTRTNRDERGAAAILMAVSSVLVLLVAALAIDVGVQRVLRRDLQAMADMVAIDMARHLDGSTHAVIKARNTWRGQLAESVQRNLNVHPAPEVKAQQAQETAVLTAVGAPDLLATAVMGWIDEDTGDFVPVRWPDDNTKVPEAVQVTISNSRDFAFGSLTGIGKGGATRSAVASRSDPSVCFSLGTKALSLNTSGSALGPVLDHILKVNLGAVSYEGIVDLKEVYAPIADVLVELNVGSVDELVGTNVSLADFMIAVADAVAANQDTASAAILRAIQLGVPGLDIPLADILDLTTGGEVAGLTSDVNVLDLLTAGIVAANGDMGLGISVPGLADAKVTQPPRIACGRKGATASSAQVDLHLEMELVESLLSTLGLGLVGGDVNLHVQVASATATISEKLSCAPESVTLDVATGAVSVLPPPPTQLSLEVTLAKVLDFLPGLVNAVLRTTLKLLGIDPIGLAVKVVGGVGASGDTVTVSFPEGPGMPERVVVPDGGLDSTLELEAVSVAITADGVVGLLTGVLNGVLEGLLSDVVAPLVNETLNPLLTALLDPVLDALGIKLGVAEVDMLGRPVCGGVRLVG